MPISKESMMQDAPASPDTGYCFMPHADGSFDENNNTFTGMLDKDSDPADWIIIDLQAGKEYEFTLEGTGTNRLEDPILTLYDSKGGVVATNDDVKAEEGDLSSKIMGIRP